MDKMNEKELEGVSGGFNPPGNLGFRPYKCPNCGFSKSYYSAQGGEKAILCPQCGQAHMEEVPINMQILEY